VFVQGLCEQVRWKFESVEVGTLTSDVYHSSSPVFCEGNDYLLTSRTMVRGESLQFLWAKNTCNPGISLP
jgi:hypothetical protein